MPYALGDSVEAFTLPNAGGGDLTVDFAAPATVLVWTCNHCPYALAWHERIQQVVRDYAGRGVRVIQINANDEVKYPLDSFAAMKERVASGELASDYLRDADQLVSKHWGAKVTPDVFVIDASGALAYRGAPDADHDDESLNAQWLRDALDDVLAGRSPGLAETKPKGCAVKWIVNDQPNPYA